MSGVPQDTAAGLDRAQKRFLIAGNVGAGLFLVGGLLDHEQFFRSYVIGWVFWVGVALGCLGLLLLQHLTGGGWGLVVRRPLEAGAATLPVMAVLFLPLLFGLGHLYEWTHAEAVAHDEVLAQKAAYLNVPFFVARNVVYFVVWIAFATLAVRWSREHDRTGDPKLAERLQGIAGPGIVAYVLTMTFASVDWLMSLEPHWFSTIYGLLLVAGQGLAAFSLVIATLVMLARARPLADVVTPEHFHDLGKLLLAFVMVWSYFAFSQFLIVWAGNLPEETPWYLARLRGGWQWLGLALVVFHFALPFVLLLSRSLKRDSRLLIRVAVLVFAMRLLDTYWMTVPAFHGGRFRIDWMDLAWPLGLGCLWLALFLRNLKRAPLLPVHDPQAQEAIAHAGD